MEKLEIVNALDFGSSTTVPKLGRAPTPKEIDLGSEDEDDLVVLVSCSVGAARLL